MPQSWSKNEVEIIVAAYFDMLAKEQSGIAYNKAATRRKILPLLQGRSNASIEFKNQNISAVLARIGQPYIAGYLPAHNYQKVLVEEVITYIQQRPEIESTFKRFAENIPPAKIATFENIVEEMPEKDLTLKEDTVTYRSPVKINYLEKEQNNSAIGKRGEAVALEFERWRLIQAGKEKLSEKIEWVSQTQGDGLGFDILSKNVNGSDRYIEVKSTKLPKETPFYFSALERDFSNRNSSSFFLYRVFNLETSPKLFIASGAYDEFCNVKPMQFKGSF